ncbi:MAG TPA: YdcF family protein [Vicinamibacterales bacterium]|jgi:uncharacterized SAM-binding protein YcdF (DUF218 family)
MQPAVRRRLAGLAAALLASGVWAFLHAGTYLQHEDDLRHADAIFVLAGTRFERALEGWDLYQEGYAPAILLSPGQDDAAAAIVRAKGVHVPGEAEPVRDALIALGARRDAVTIAEGVVDNTAAEALMLGETARRRGWHDVIVVTSKYHTRRAGFAMRRALAGTDLRIIMRASRYDGSDPAHWWRHRGDVRWLMQEWPKLLAYRLGLAS